MNFRRQCEPSKPNSIPRRIDASAHHGDLLELSISLFPELRFASHQQRDLRMSSMERRGERGR